MANRKLKQRPKAYKEKMRIRMRQYWADRKKAEKNGQQVPKKKTNLSFLTDIRSQRRGGWTLPTAEKLVECIRERMIDETYGGYKFDAKLAAKETGMSENACQMFVHELKRAERENYTLEQYFRAGRPLRPGKKVLA